MEEPTTSSNSSLKKGFLCVLISVQEGFGYVKAFFVGQTKRITAKNEKEATRAEMEMEMERRQVEATDAAENSKKRLEMSS